MSRPAVLLVEPQAARRKELSRGLSSLGYEVIPAIDERQGRRFLQEMGELGPAVVMAPLGFVDPRAGAPTTQDGVETDNGNPRTLLLLGEREEDGQDLPGEVPYLATGGLAAGELVRRVHVLLLGREVGVEADSQLASLVGDLELTPLLELLRALQRAEVSGRLVHAAGEVTLIRGQVVAAAAGATRGLKAFCRLSHLDSGPVRVVPAAADDEIALGRGGVGEPEIREDMKALIIRALEDRVHDGPAPRSRLRLEIGADFFERSFT
ncbi:MAG TPA: hypothetical protein VOA80_20665, partial [Thermoanaerobaculia bacterium]|nr:hypothetical protein [Thermoanaerobaculia bacterium]